LEKYASVLNTDNRLNMCRALILMRNKNLLEPTALLPLFFKMLHCQDRKLRKYLETHIITDVKNVNSKSKNMRVNTVLQNFMFGMIKDSNVKAMKMSLNIMIELYRKNIWNDTKTVNVIASACFSKVTKVMVTAIQFFLANEGAGESDEESSDEDAPTVKDVSMANRVNKKTRKRDKNLDKVQKMIKKKKRKKNKAPNFNFSALHLIHDPQGFAEKLFKQLESLNERFEVKIMTLDLISRLVGTHQLIVLNYYPYIKRFLQPHQRDVTKILQFVAQAAHDLVPPDAIEGVVEAIANNFVTERNSADVMAVGLNAIRELCARCPLAMNRDLLIDLAQYKSYREKSVMMAARSLIHLFRDVNPNLLHKRDKGKPTLATMEKKVKQFGEIDAKEFIPGAEALVGPQNDNSDEDDDDGDTDEEWVDVSHSENEEGESDEEVEGEEEDEEEDIGSGEEDENDDKEESKKGKEKKEKAPEMDPLDRLALAKELISTTILTDEDFKKMEKLQMQKEIVGARKGSAKKRKASEAFDNTAAQVNELVDLAAIENIHKKRRHDKEARLETVRKGQEGRDKFGSRKGKMSPFASTSNKEKRKTKNFMMLKHKIKSKKKKSFKEKQFSYRKSLEKTRKRMLKK
jgi:protein SDA1